MSKPKSVEALPVPAAKWPADRAAFEAWACAEPEGVFFSAGYAPPPSKLNPHLLAARARPAAAQPSARKPKRSPRRRTRSSPSAA